MEDVMLSLGLLSFWALVLLVTVGVQRRLRARDTLGSNCRALLLFLVPVAPPFLVYVFLSPWTVTGDAPPLFLLRYNMLWMAGSVLVFVFLLSLAGQVAFWAFF